MVMADVALETNEAIRKSSSDGGGALSTRPRSGAASASSSSARPLSASNLMASVANARFKSFQVQHEILSKNPVLGAIATEIIWKNLLDLFQLKFYGVGDVLWEQGRPAHEMAFVLCGGFLARHMEYDSELAASSSLDSDQDGGKQRGSVRAEKMVKPGASLAALAVHCNSPMQYAVVTAKFKSIVLALPAGKYKSILRQLSPECMALVETLLYEAENKLLLSLKKQPLAPPKGGAATFTRMHQHHQQGPSNAVAPAKKLHQIAKPIEYEVNSSLLILHESSYNKSTDDLHRLVPAAVAGPGRASRKQLGGARGVLHASSTARLAAKKHTQRRLQSIKLPNPVEAFPPPSKRLIGDDDSDANLLLIAEMALEERTTKRGGHLDVVPKMHVGRLLKPLQKPVMLRVNEDRVSEDMRGGTLRPHTVAVAERINQRVLVANRAEPFRDMR